MNIVIGYSAYLCCSLLCSYDRCLYHGIIIDRVKTLNGSIDVVIGYTT